MNLLWLLSVVTAANSLIVVDYDGGPVQGDAWITLTIHGDPAQLLNLQHVTWCKSFVPNEDGPSPLSPDCGGRNLMRLQLFPSAEEVVLKELPSSETLVSATTAPAESLLPRFYIDPARVGGWDTRHQWNIYLEMSQRNGALHQESIRFNPLTPATTAAVPTITATTSSSFSSDKEKEPTTTVNDDNILTQNPSGTVVTAHSWKGALLVLSVGSFLILGVVAGIQFLRTNNRQRRQPSLAHQRDQMQGQLYGGTYAFQHESIEMADFSASSQEDPEEEERLREEDLQVLGMIK